MRPWKVRNNRCDEPRDESCSLLLSGTFIFARVRAHSRYSSLVQLSVAVLGKFLVAEPFFEDMASTKPNMLALVQRHPRPREGYEHEVTTCDGSEATHLRMNDFLLCV